MNKRLNVICFSLVCIIIAYTEIRKCQRFPFPSRFIYTALAFLMTDFLGMFTPELATTVTVGLTLAAMVSKNHIVGHCGPWSPTGRPQDTAFLTATDIGPDGTVNTGTQPPSEQLLMPPETPQQASIQGYQPGGVVT